MLETRNIIDYYDYYHYWKTEAIKADLDQKRHNFSVLVSNVLNDFNLGTVVRNCNAFLGKEVIIYGRRHWDRRGSVGTHNYENFRHIREVDELKINSDISVIGVDNVPQAVPIDTFEWPKNHVIRWRQETAARQGRQVGTPT